MQAPQVLARLPRALDEEYSHVYSAEVFSVLGSEKKKRPELAVAVDGEGVTIYDVRSSKLVSSYAVPSRSIFTCAPTSIRQKRLGSTPTRRMTYCSIGGPKPTLQCFVEKMEDHQSLDEHIATFSHVHSAAKSPVIQIETILKPSLSYPGHSDISVLAIHEDGEIRRLSEDLTVELWNFKTADSNSHSGNQKHKVLSAAMISGEQASKGLLKNRQDVLAVLESRPMNPGLPSFIDDILVLVTQPMESDPKKDRGSILIRIFSLRASQSQASSLAQKTQLEIPMTEVLKMSMTESEHLRRSNSTFFIHKATGNLYQYGKKSLLVHELSGHAPRVEYRVQTDQKIRSCLRLSSTSVVLASPSSLSTINARYNSLVATGPIRHELGGNGSKTQDFKVEGSENTQLISYFASFETVVALQGRTLVSFSLMSTESAEPPSRKRTRQGLLINAVGRGVGMTLPDSRPSYADLAIPIIFGKLMPLPGADADWIATMAKLNALAKAGDTKGFDTTVMAEIERCRPDITSMIISNPTLREAVASRGGVRLDQHKVDYLLGKIFLLQLRTRDTELCDDFQAPLEIKFFPTRTFQWLVQNRALTLQHIESALKKAGALSVIKTLPACAIVEALAANDPSLQSLMVLLASPSMLLPQEVAAATRRALEILQQPESAVDVKLITNGGNEDELEHGSDTDMQLLQGNRLEKFSNPEDNADKIHDAQAVMAICLSRLSRCHEIDIRTALTAELSRSDLIHLIDYLRMELAGGGWLSRYIDDDGASIDERSQQTDQMSITAKLLNCAIDSLGAGAWLLGSSTGIDMLDTADTIAYMKAEISAALEGIEEAAYLEGMLHEVLLYSKTAASAQEKPEGTDRPKAIKPITVTNDEEQLSVLPIGLKAKDDKVGFTKIGAGGEIQERSMRDIGRLKSMKVDLYSFERILI